MRSILATAALAAGLLLQIPAQAAWGTITTYVEKVKVGPNTMGSEGYVFGTFSAGGPFGGCVLDNGKLFLGVSATSPHGQEVIKILHQAFISGYTVTVSWDDSKLVGMGQCKILSISLNYW